MSANERQVGGDHYKAPIQHWDWAASNNLDYFQGQITKYVARWKNKGGLEDLAKARHFLEKYIELQVDEGEEASPAYVNQDPLDKYCDCDEPEYAKDDEPHEHCIKCDRPSIF